MIQSPFPILPAVLYFSTGKPELSLTSYAVPALMTLMISVVEREVAILGIMATTALESFVKDTVFAFSTMAVRTVL